jgi:hypothetical protein
MCSMLRPINCKHFSPEENTEEVEGTVKKNIFFVFFSLLFAFKVKKCIQFCNCLDLLQFIIGGNLVPKTYELFPNKRFFYLYKKLNKNE